MTTEERFWSKVDRSAGDDGCWLWTGRGRKEGYGQFWHEGRHVLAHRFSYALQHGQVPRGAVVCHSCDVPACVNPAHLWIGSRGANNADRDRKGRQRSLRGEDHYRARLTESDVLAIRQASLRGESQRSLAARFGVSRWSIVAIVKRRNWAHV